MLTSLFFALTLSAASPAAAVELSPEAKALIAPVFEAYDRVTAEQATLPPAKDDAERLIRLRDYDQAGRLAWVKIDLSALPKDQYYAATARAWDRIDAVDADDLAKLKAMLPQQGWFTISRYGADASNAAFLIVQHAVADKPFMALVLARMQPLVAKGEVSGSAYALLYDRVALQQGRPQRYGSQMRCKDHQIYVENLEDPAHVDERRKSVGLTQTLEDYKAALRQFDAACR